MAQDWEHPTAQVDKVYDVSAENCKADVVIRDGEERDVTVTLFLVKENNQWKVDDFSIPGSDVLSFAQMLKADFDAAKQSVLKEL